MEAVDLQEALITPAVAVSVEEAAEDRPKSKNRKRVKANPRQPRSLKVLKSPQGRRSPAERKPRRNKAKPIEGSQASLYG